MKLGKILYILAIVVLVGVNFIIEFGANLVLSPAIASIVNAVKKIGR